MTRAFSDMGVSIRRISILLDHLLKRDKYLSELNRRIDYFKDIESSPTGRVIDGADDLTLPEKFTVPEVAASELTLDFLKNAMRQNGCCLVRNYFDADEADELKAYIDHSFSVHNSEGFIHNYLSKQVELREVLEKTKKDIEENKKTNETYTDIVKLGRNLTRTLGVDVSCLTATSPILAQKLLQLFDKKGLRDLLSEYFENEPCVSVYKWVLRKAVSPQKDIDFHQDGAFMGDYIDSLNCWVPLTDCGAGTETPGIDIVPIRFMNSFAKGTGVLNWTISSQAVVDKYGEKAVVTPSFSSGDAFFFDHCLVHRTQHIPNSTAERYAVETWFFDSVNFPKNQIPIQW
jgi:ectoine hydroxylase-related dioxygenase (phytanoyl-CoA dioxygenase family)